MSHEIFLACGEHVSSHCDLFFICICKFDRDKQKTGYLTKATGFKINTEIIALICLNPLRNSI